MRKHKILLSALTLSLLFACGEKEPPPNVSAPGGGLGSLGGADGGGITPLEPLDDGTGDDLAGGIEPAPDDFAPGDDFVDEVPADEFGDEVPPEDEFVDEPPLGDEVSGDCPEPVEGEEAVDCAPVEEPPAECPEPVEGEEPVDCAPVEDPIDDGEPVEDPIVGDDPVVGDDPTTDPTPEPTAEPTPEPTPVPVIPQNVATSNATVNSFDVSWGAVTGATSYKVYVNGTLTGDNVSGTTYTATGLSPSTSYTVAVSAVTADGEGAQSASTSVTTSSIGAPQGLSANNIKGSSVGLSWSSVAAATEYKVYVNGGLSASSITAPNTTLTGLTPETTYSISVSAVTPDGESAQSSAISVTTIDPFGNKRLGFLQVPAMENMDGLDIKNNHAYIGHFRNPGFFSSNRRLVRDYNLASGQTQDITISTGGDTKISGVAVSGALIWSTVGQFDNDDRNLYKHNVTGERLNRFKVGQSGTLISDVAVDPASGVVYMGSRTSNSIIKYNDTDGTSQQFFSGATNIDPLGLAVGPSGHVYTFDGISRKIIKYSKADGARLLEFGPTGANSQGENYGAVEDVAIDPRNGDIYVVGNGNSGVKIFRYDSNGNFLRSISDADLTSPKKMSVDVTGKVYVIDSLKKGVLVFDAGTRP